MLLCVSGLAACGARSSLPIDEAGSGGGTTTGPTTTSTSVTQPPACDGLSQVQTFAFIPSTGVARRPQIVRLPGSNDVLLAFIEASNGKAGGLTAARMAPFTTWPPSLTDAVGLAAGVKDFTISAGPNGPVGLIDTGAPSGPVLATSFYPQVQSTGLSLGQGDVEDAPLFVAESSGRYLVALGGITLQGMDPMNQNEVPVLRVGSYSPNTALEEQGPEICAQSEIVGAAIPSGAGFLAAFAEPPAAQSCNLVDKPPSSTLSVKRYDPAPGGGSALTLTQGAEIKGQGEITLLAMVPASFGAWAVSRGLQVPKDYYPPALALRVDASGNELVKGEQIQVSTPGMHWPFFAAAALGDTLAVASVDNTVFPSPNIEVQLVRPDGSLGPSTTISTDAGVLTGRIEMLSSADGRSLLLAWEDADGGAGLVFARIDCVSDP